MEWVKESRFSSVIFIKVNINASTKLWLYSVFFLPVKCYLSFFENMLNLHWKRYFRVAFNQEHGEEIASYQKQLLKWKKYMRMKVRFLQFVCSQKFERKHHQYQQVSSLKLTFVDSSLSIINSFKGNLPVICKPVN